MMLQLGSKLHTLPLLHNTVILSKTVAFQTFGRIFKLILGICLLILYLGANTQIGFLHQLIHPDEVAVFHSANEEKDPCHRSIYHGQDTGCNHQFHLGKLNSCSLTHTLAHTDQIVFTTDRSVFISYCTSEVFNGDHPSTLIDVSSIFLRGPPALLTRLT